MMKTTKLLLAVVLSFTLNTLLAQTDSTKVHNFKLESCINYAYEHQTAILNAKIDEEIAKYKVRETIAIGLPQVSGVANFQDFLAIPTSLIPGELAGKPGEIIPVQFGVKYQANPGINVSQLLFDGSYLVGLKASQTFKELSSRALTRTKVETAVAVSQAYYSVLIANERLTLLDANISRLQKTLNDTKQYLKNGFAEKIDVDRLTVLSNNIQTERSNVLRLLDLNNNLLKFQMGMPIGDKLIINEKIENISFTKETITADTSAYLNRPEYALAQTSKKLNQLDLKRYKSQSLPSLAAFGSFSRAFLSNNFNTLFDRSFPTSLIGLQLNIPIFSSGQRYYRVKQAKLAVTKSDNDLFNLQNGINLQINQSQTAYINGITSLENQKSNRTLAQEVLRVTKVKYEQGVGSSLEVTTAETALKEAETNYIGALYDALINKVNLDKALGRIR
jgi:outer membrane protein